MSDAKHDLVQDMLDRVIEIKSEHPELSASVDGLEEELRDLMEKIRGELDTLDAERDRKLMTVYLINIVHKGVDEILAD